MHARPPRLCAARSRSRVPLAHGPTRPARRRARGGQRVVPPVSVGYDARDAATEARAVATTSTLGLGASVIGVGARACRARPPHRQGSRLCDLRDALHQGARVQRVARLRGLVAVHWRGEPPSFVPIRRRLRFGRRGRVLKGRQGRTGYELAPHPSSPHPHLHPFGMGAPTLAPPTPKASPTTRRPRPATRLRDRWAATRAQPVVRSAW